LIKFYTNIAKGESSGKRKSYFQLGYAESSSTNIGKDKSRIKWIRPFFIRIVSYVLQVWAKG